MVLDTETTGLPERNAPPSDYTKYDGCRMVQIAWNIYTAAGELQSEEEYVVKPDNFVIPERAVQIHGITNDHALSCGETMEFVLSKLHAALQGVDTIVAHNMSFDNGVVLAEMYRFNTTTLQNPNRNIVDVWLSKRKHCTMLMGHQTGRRWPKLVDLYTRLFNVAPTETLHRADADVRVCASVYFELLKSA